LLRKNKGPVLAATLILMTLLLGMVGTGWQAIRAERARATQESQRQIAEASEKRALQAAASEKEAHRQEATQRVRAEKATEKAEEILNAMVSGVAADSLTTQTAISEDQKKFLTGVLRYYRELAAEKEEDTPAKIANAAFRVGIIEDRLGRKLESEIAFREARDLYQKLTEHSSDGFKFRQRLALCYNNLGNAASDKGEIREAEQSYREAIRVQEQIAGGAWLYTPEYQSDLALSHNNLGALYVKLGRKDDAKDEYQKALAIREKLAESFPGNPVYQAGLAKTHNHLGILSRSLGNREAAEEHYSRALAIRQQLVSDFPANPQYTYELAASHFNIGNMRHDEKQWQPAEQQYLKALPMLEKLAAQYPSVPDYQADLGKCYTSLGGIFRRDGRLLEAEEMLRKGVAIQERQAAESPSDHERRFSVASSRALLSLLLQTLGKHADAETELMTVCEIQEKLVTEYPDLAKYQLGLAGSYLSLGAIRSRSGRRAESIQPLANAIQVLAPRADRDNKAKLALCDAHVERAKTYASLNQFTLALEDWDKAIKLSSLSSPERQANFRASRAITQLQLGEMEESLEEVLNLASNYSNSKGVQYSCACFFALASARADDKKQEYETRAIESLMRAVAAGFDDAAHLKQDTDLDSLRGREDFKALVTKLEQTREKK
jgi:tetratricopeptide (TPR) repeat protein